MPQSRRTSCTDQGKVDRSAKAAREQSLVAACLAAVGTVLAFVQTLSARAIGTNESTWKSNARYLQALGVCSILVGIVLFAVMVAAAIADRDAQGDADDNRPIDDQPRASDIAISAAVFSAIAMVFLAYTGLSTAIPGTGAGFSDYADQWGSHWVAVAACALVAVLAGVASAEISAASCGLAHSTSAGGSCGLQYPHVVYGEGQTANRFSCCKEPTWSPSCKGWYFYPKQ